MIKLHYMHIKIKLNKKIEICIVVLKKINNYIHRLFNMLLNC